MLSGKFFAKNFPLFIFLEHELFGGQKLIYSGIEHRGFIESAGFQFDFAFLIDEKMRGKTHIDCAAAPLVGVFQNHTETVWKDIKIERCLF